MKRVSIQESFAWAFFFLIFAASFDVVEGVSTRLDKNVAATAQNNENQTSAQNGVPTNGALPRLDAAIGNVATGATFDRSRETRRVLTRRVSVFERSARSAGGVPTALKLLRTANRRWGSDDFGVSFHCFFSCQTVSRPLFLTLRTLLN